MTYTTKQFVEILAPSAKAAMIKSGISAALSIAQGIIESRSGNSGLTRDANNLFGMKGTGDQGQVTMRTREEDKNGKSYYIDAKFAKFSSWAACMDARVKLLLGGVSWNRDIYKGVIGKKGRDAAVAIAAAGYATDKKYASILISVMDAYNLYQYDQIATPQPVPEYKIGIFMVDGKDEGDAYTIDGVTWVPLRALGEAVNLQVGWDNKRKVAQLNGRDVQVIKTFDNTTFIQLRPVAKAMGKSFGNEKGNAWIKTS